MCDPFDIDVAAISIARRVAILTDHTTIPITHLFDSAGDETQDEKAAVTFVCGIGGLWFAGAVESFEKVSTH